MRKRKMQTETGIVLLLALIAILGVAVGAYYLPDTLMKWISGIILVLWFIAIAL